MTGHTRITNDFKIRKMLKYTAKDIKGTSYDFDTIEDLAKFFKISDTKAFQSIKSGKLTKKDESFTVLRNKPYELIMDGETTSYSHLKEMIVKTKTSIPFLLTRIIATEKYEEPSVKIDEQIYQEIKAQ